MKKLNRKGFTLIELLAVIVILAIILVVTVPNIISSINDARVSSLHNLAVAAAQTYENAYAQDQLRTDKILGTIPEYVNGYWMPISHYENDDDDDGNVINLVDILGLSANDIVIDCDEDNVFESQGDYPDEQDMSYITSATCSSIRIHNGKIELLLVAKPDGKFGIANKTVYAFSFADNGGTN